MGYPEKLAPLKIWNSTGEEVVLGSLWQDKPAVLVYLRHFGCIFCREHAVELQPYLPKIRELGAELYLISSGAVDRAAAFKQEFNLACPVLTDPSLKSYTAADFKKRTPLLSLPKVMWRAAKAMSHGFRQTKTQGDTFQLGGSLVVAPGNRELFYYRSDSAGDNAKPEALIEALQKGESAAASRSA